MKSLRLPFFVLVTVVALVALLVLEVRGNLGRGPEDLLADAREGLARAKPAPPSLVLRELDTALAMARADDRPDLVVEILDARAKLLHDRRAFQTAKRDFEELLTFAPADPIPYRVRLLQIAVESGSWSDAIAACEAFLLEQPSHPTALNVLGRSCEIGAKERWRALDARMAAALTRTAYMRAIELAERITRFPAGSAQSVQFYRELLLVFVRQNALPPVDLESELDAIVALRDRSRQAFAEVLSGYLDPQAAGPLVDAFLRCGAIDHAALIAELALQSRESQSNLDFMQRAIEVLIESGDAVRAGVLARDWLAARGEGFVNSPTYLALGKALLAAGEWEALAEMGALYLERAPRAEPVRFHRDSAQAFIGYAAAALGDDDLAQRSFTAILFPEAVPDVDGAVVDALEWLADHAKRTGRRELELSHLARLCDLAPRRAGERWLRRAELEASLVGDLEAALATVTRGITELPERAQEWFPRWREYALASLARRGRSLDVLAADVTVRGLGVRELGISDTDQYLLIERLVEMKRYGAARYSGLLLEERLPNFAPLIERRLEADIALRFLADARYHAVRLVALGAKSAPVEDFLRSQWNRGELPLEAVFEIVSGTTSDFGTLLFLSGHLEQGRPDLALAELERWRDQNVGAADDGLAQIAARIHFELNDAVRAYEELAALEPTSAAFADALPLFARALVSVPTDERFEQFRSKVAAANALDATTAIATARELLDGGRGDWALELLAPVRTEELAVGAQLFELRALAALAARRADEASENLARSRAFVDAESANLGELLFAILAGGERDVERALERVDPSGRRALERCALALIAGEFVEVRALVPAAPTAAHERPLWAAIATATRTSAALPPHLELSGSAALEFERSFGGPPSNAAALRRFAGALLADANAEWAPWSSVALGRLEARRGLWPGLFAWRAALQGGDERSADEHALALAEAFPDFTAVWDELVARFRRTPTDLANERFLAAWAARVAAGESDADSGLATSAVAVGAARETRLEAAVESARTAAASASPHPLTWLVLARIERAAGDHSRARAAYDAALSAVESEAAAPLLAEYLAYLEELLLSGIVPAAEHATTLATLAASHQDDETVRAHGALAAIALWRETSEKDALESRRATFEAIRSDLATEWRERLVSSGRPLGAEAAAVLARALRMLDPALGVELFEAELAAGPTRLDLWLCTFELLEAAERHEEALERSARLATIVSAPELALWRAGLLARLGGERSDEARRLIDALPAGTVVPLDTRARLALAADDDELVRSTCHDLWQDATGTPRAPAAALLFAHAMVRLGGAEAKREARGVVRSALDQQDVDPLTRAVLESLDHLCRLGG